MVRALTHTVRGVVLSPTWHYSFPCLFASKEFHYLQRIEVFLKQVFDLQAFNGDYRYKVLPKEERRQKEIIEREGNGKVTEKEGISCKE